MCNSINFVLSDRCGLIIHCFGHCTKPKGASERVYTGRQFAATEIDRFFFYKASTPIHTVIIDAIISCSSKNCLGNNSQNTIHVSGYYCDVFAC